MVNASLIYCNLDEREVEQFVDLMEDADAVRQALPTRGMISFVAEGAQDLPARIVRICRTPCATRSSRFRNPSA